MKPQIEHDELLRQRDLLWAACEEIRTIAVRQHIGEPTHPGGCACPWCHVRDVSTRAIAMSNMGTTSTNPV